MQTKIQSLIESFTNVIIWYLISVWSTFLIFPMFDINISASDNFLIWFYFTIISIIRSYLIRRYYNLKK